MSPPSAAESEKLYRHGFYMLREFLGWNDLTDWPGNAEFRTRLGKIAQKYQNLLASTFESENTRIDARSDAGWLWLRHENHQYADAIVRAAEDFGLLPVALSSDWWVYEWLHYIVSRDAANAAGGESLLEQGNWFPKTGGRRPHKIFTLTWTMLPWSNKREERDALLKTFDEQWRDGSKFIGTAADRQFAKHMRWLYLALCRQEPENRPLYYREIADRHAGDPKPPGEDTVGKAVSRLSGYLGIALPHSQGRPRAN